LHCSLCPRTFSGGRRRFSLCPRRLLGVAAAALLYAAAFSIYQSVLANAATIFCIWLLSRLLFARPEEPFAWKAEAKTSIGALLAVGVGGLIYMAAVSTMDLKFDSYQSAGQAFNLSKGLNLHMPQPRSSESREAFSSGLKIISQAI